MYGRDAAVYGHLQCTDCKVVTSCRVRCSFLHVVLRQCSHTKPGSMSATSDITWNTAGCLSGTPMHHAAMANKKEMMFTLARLGCDWRARAEGIDGATAAFVLCGQHTRTTRQQVCCCPHACPATHAGQLVMTPMHTRSVSGCYKLTAHCTSNSCRRSVLTQTV